ncbi:MAG: hypothetical protein NTV19_12810, partial [Burkholderiales bacterium]|nr:hypothetical protein [Burkholderiales bacterium]
MSESEPVSSQDPERRRGLPAAVAAPVSAAEERVLRALAMAWTPRHRKWLIDLFRRLELRTERGLYFGQADIDEPLVAMAGRGLVARSDLGWQCAPEHRIGTFRRALAAPDFVPWREAVQAADGSAPSRSWFHFAGVGTAVTVARLSFYGGDPVERWRQIEQAGQHLPEWSTVIDQVVLSGFDAECFERAEPALAVALLVVALDFGLHVLHPNLPALVAHGRALLARGGRLNLRALRSRVGEVLLLGGQVSQAQSLIEGAHDGHALALRAAAHAVQGRWVPAIEGFEEALALRREETGLRKRLLPDTLVWLYPMCLFATREPARIAQARKFCAAEGGSRKPGEDTVWGRWTRAADIRLGDEPADPAFGELHPWFGTRPQFFWTDRLMLRAWVLGAQPPSAAPAFGSSGYSGRDPATARAAAMASLHRALEQTDLAWLAQQLRSAEQVLAGQSPEQPFFVPAVGDAWRDALAAIAALGPPAGAEGEAQAPAATRLLWSLEVDANGRLTGIEALEQKRGVRDWNKPRAVAWSRLARSADLPADDARVARAVKQRRGYGPGFDIDLTEAAATLAGHPRVVMAGAPERFVLLTDEQPDVRLEAAGDHWVFRFEPDLLALSRQASGFEFDENGTVRGGALPLDGAVFVLPDRPGHARLIRINAAHRRVVALAAGGLKVPRTAVQELQSALPALAAHFRLRADEAHGAQAVSASGRLRAELSPVGEGVRLRLVSAPLGPRGPRLAPGAGRLEVVAPIDAVVCS